MSTLPAERLRYSPFYGIGHLVCSIVSRVFFWRTIVGRENWIRGPAILTANHASFLDPPLIGSACPEQIAYLARRDLFGNVLFRKMCFGLRAIPVDRDAADYGSIKRVLGALEMGRKVLLFPEGVRTFDGNFREPRAGIGLLVHRARVPVIPIYIHGTYKAWPRHRRLPVPRRVIVVFGKPVRFDQHDDVRPTRETYQAIADRVMDHIKALVPQAIAAL